MLKGQTVFLQETEKAYEKHFTDNHNQCKPGCTSHCIPSVHGRYNMLYTIWL